MTVPARSSRYLFGIGCCCLATLGWSLSGLFVRWVPELDGWGVNGYRAPATAVCLLIYLAVRYRERSAAPSLAEAAPGLVCRGGVLWHRLHALRLRPDHGKRRERLRALRDEPILRCGIGLAGDAGARLRRVLGSDGRGAGRRCDRGPGGDVGAGNRTLRRHCFAGHGLLLRRPDGLASAVPRPGDDARNRAGRVAGVRVRLGLRWLAAAAGCGRSACCR